MTSKFSVLLLILIYYISNVHNSVYEVENMINYSGLLIEKGPPVKIVRGHWKIVHYIDIIELETIKEQLYDGINNMIKKCNSKMQTKIFLPHFNILSTGLDKIQNISDAIINSLSKRQKRDVPFGFIGSISRLLFGTLDTSDLKQIKSLISESNEKIHNITELIRDQTMIVKTKFKNIHLTIQKMQEVYNDTTSKLIKLQNISLSNAMKINELNESISIMQSISLADSFITSLKDDYNLILEAILKGQNQVLHPLLLSKEKIFNIAQNIFFNKSNEIYPGNIDSFDDFTRLIKFSMYLEKGKILFIILIPFTNKQNFTMYHVLPQMVNLTIGFGYTKPQSEYYIVQNKNTVYVTLTQTQFRDCKSFYKKYVCDDVYMYRKLKSSSPCEIRLIFSKEIKNIDSCDIRLTKEVKSYFTPSLDIYKIFFSIPFNESLTITCQNDITNVYLQGVGAITLSESCNLESQEYQYKTPKTRTFISSETISPTLNLNIIQQLLEIINQNSNNKTIFDKSEFFYMHHIDDEFGVASVKLNDIIKRAEELNARKTFLPHVSEYTYGIPTLLVIVMILIFFLSKWMKNRGSSSLRPLKP